MAKSPPGVRAEGVEAETAGQPLIAQLKQDRADIAKAKAEAEAAAKREADERVNGAIDAFTEYVSLRVIDANSAMKSSHTEMLLGWSKFSLPGSKLEPKKRIEFDHKRIIRGIRVWARKNGIGMGVKKLGILHGTSGSEQQPRLAYCINASLTSKRECNVAHTVHKGEPNIRINENRRREEERLEENRAEWELYEITFSWEAE